MGDALFLVALLGAVVVGVVLLLGRSTIVHRVTHSKFVQALVIVIIVIAIVTWMMAVVER